MWGNSTLFDGALVETAETPSDLALRSGARLRLDKGSRVRVWESRVAIERGAGRVTSVGPFEVSAAGLQIRAGSRASIRVGVGASVEVEALSGDARVANGNGLILASILPGRVVSFAPQAGLVTRIGCLLYKDGQFILQDENTQEVSEVHGADLGLNTGNRVEIGGNIANTRPTVTLATVYINVVTVSPRSQGGCLTVASSLDASTTVPRPGAPVKPTAGTAQTGPPRGEGGGMSTGAKVAIASAVTGGGVGGALAALRGKKSTSP